MRRKSIIWIVAGVLAAGVLAAVAIVFYHVGFDHGANSGVVSRVRLPLRGGVAIGFPRRFGGNGLGGFGVFLALLAAGGIGALIVYLVGPGHQRAAVVASGPAPTPGGPCDPGRQQFEQWQQFEEWHRQTHGAAAPEAPTAPPQAPVASQNEPAATVPDAAATQNEPAAADLAVPDAAADAAVPDAPPDVAPPGAARPDAPAPRTEGV
jgi:hypothetical protein